MYEDIVSERLAKLRGDKISARGMSLDIGQSAGYINSIETGRTLPSMQGFFYICEYLNVTPSEFFDMENDAPEVLRALISNLKTLDKESLLLISALVEKLKSK